MFHLLSLSSPTGRSMWAGASRPKSHFSRRRNTPTLTPTMHFSCGLPGKNWTFLSINREVASHSHTHTHISDIQPLLMVTSLSSAADGSLQRGASGRSQPGVCSPHADAMQRRLCGKTSLALLLLLLFQSK